MGLGKEGERKKIIYEYLDRRFQSILFLEVVHGELTAGDEDEIRVMKI